MQLRLFTVRNGRYYCTAPPSGREATVPYIGRSGAWEASAQSAQYANLPLNSHPVPDIA